jgi:hypothetical protein
MKKLLLLAACSAAALLSGCDNDARVASRNLSEAADNFQIARRVVFYNGITGEYILSVEGLCSIDNDAAARKVAITCKTAPGVFKKHFLGLSDNVTYFAEQMDAASVSTARYKVTFKPSVIVPDVQLR